MPSPYEYSANGGFPLPGQGMISMALVDKELPTRKQHQLKEHDYKANGAYFLTIVTKQRIEVLGSIVGKIIKLSPIGEAAASCIGRIEEIYPSVRVSASIVMPNHVHLLLDLMDNRRNPSVKRIVQQWKGAVSKQAGYSLWQEGFDDRLILTTKRYNTVEAYIKSNPSKWMNDRYNPINDNITEPPSAERS